PVRPGGRGNGRVVAEESADSLQQARGPDSVRASSGEDRRNAAGEQSEVLPWTPACDVTHVHAHPLHEPDLAPPADLPEARDAADDAEAPALPALVLLDLVERRGPRADEGEVPFEDVPQLRELVEAPAAQHAAYAGDPRIVADLEDRTDLLVQEPEVL